MKVNEAFVSIQGEGPNAGRLALFIRTSGCNLNCHFCDTKYANDTYFDVEVHDLIDMVNRSGVGYVVITGGEPLIQSDTEQLATLLTDVGIYVDIETNGTVIPCECNEARYIVSPKYESNKKVDRLETATNWLDSGYTYVFKFVVGPTEDMSELITWLKENKEFGAYFMPMTPIWSKLTRAEIIEYDIKTGIHIMQEMKRLKYDGYLCTRLQNLYGVR